MMRLVKNQKPDYLYALLVFVMIFLGIVMIASSSVVVSFEQYGTNYHFVIRQIISWLIGIGLMFTTYFIDYRFWRKNSLWFFLLTIGLLILIFIPGIGHEFGGARRWIGIGSALFQPSEIVKISFIIYLAAWLDKKGEDIKSFWKGFLPFVVLIAIVSALIIKQPDLGTLSVILLVAAAMFFTSGANLIHLGLGTAGLAVLFFIFIKAAPYRMQRFLVFFNPSLDSQGAAYHINQALLAIGTGGLWGLGFGQSRQKYLYLPMPHTDSIFAIIAEELGFIRTSLFLLLFLAIVFKGFQIAKNAPDNFARLLATGITFWILIQAFINIASMLNIVPMTGVPLPFISYGGSSLVMLLAAVGIMLNISKASSGEKL
jgi:cell division protein FtsW